MKKIVSILIAAALCAAMSVTAFAAEGNGKVESVTNGSNTQSFDVNGTFKAGASSTTVYSVDIAWGSMDFTYTAASNGTWNPESHEYDNKTAAAWSWDADANKITVTNHSNAAVDAALSFTATATGITGAFKNASTAGSAITGNKLALATADGTALAAAPTAAAYLQITGGSIAASDKIGTVTVTLTAPTGASGDDLQDGGHYGRG